MTPEQWRRVNELYHAALKTPPEARSAFVAQHANDDTVDQEVHRLLAVNPESTAAKVAGQNGANKAQSHDEPPIGGGDGSFLLTMDVQKGLAGTNDKTLKVCGVTHNDAEGEWFLKWMVWNPGGSMNDSGSQLLDLPNLTQVSVEVSFINSPEKVTISRTTSTLGSAWQATSGQAKFKVSAVTSGSSTDGVVNELDIANSSTLKMKELNVTGVSKTSTPFGDVRINLDRGQIPGQTCSGFVICHDGNCPVISQPKACTP